MVCLISFLLLLNTIDENRIESLNASIDSSDVVYSVKWVNQFPSLNAEKKVSFKEWLERMVFGKPYSNGLIRPVAIIASNPDLYLILDQGNGTISKISNNKKLMPRVFEKRKISFSSLVGFCTISNNNLLFTDSRLNKIYSFSEEQNKFTEFNINLKLQKPTGIAFSQLTKEIWLIETDLHRISVLNENGERIKTIGKRGSKEGEFNYPTSIWIDASGNAYIIDAMNFRVQVFNKFGEVISVFGEIGDASGYFARPKGIATDSYGNIYISDALYHIVQVFDISGNFLYRFGGQGRDKEKFWMPSGIYIDEKNFIYIADSYNSRVQIFQLITEK